MSLRGTMAFLGDVVIHIMMSPSINIKWIAAVVSLLRNDKTHDAACPKISDKLFSKPHSIPKKEQKKSYRGSLYIT